jgi:hypothetical protein
MIHQFPVWSVVMRCLQLLVLMLFVSVSSPANEEFFAAARKGEVAALKAHLDKGVPVDTKWRYDQTALIIAASRGHVDAVKLLLERGAAVNIKDSFYGVTPLGASAGFGTPLEESKTISMANMLIQKGASDKDQFLVQTIRAGKPNVVKGILPATEWSPQSLSAALAVAAASKQKEIEEILKAAGAQPAPEVKVDAATLARYAGSYEGATDKSVLKIEAADGKLNAVMGGRTFALRALDATAFEPAEFPGSQKIVFLPEADRVTGLEVRAGTNVMKFIRIAGGPQ